MYAINHYNHRPRDQITLDCGDERSKRTDRHHRSLAVSLNFIGQQFSADWTSVSGIWVIHIHLAGA
jgi:hypothetical protein